MIHRSEHVDNFTVIDNEIIRSSELSEGSRFLLIYLLSMSDGWSFSVNGIASLLGWHPRKVSRHITELKKAGYIVQEVHKDKGGKFLPSEWHIYEVPTANTKNRSAAKCQDKKYQ